MRNEINFNVNGKDVKEVNPDPETTLASYLRLKLGLTGTKIGCEEGSCGACTVVCGKWDENKARYYSVNACITPLFLVDGCMVITVEGIGNRKKIHAVQERIAKGHGTQCGFCSPGFVMAAYALLRNNPNPTKKDVRDAIRGNLCRCTGYRPILEALYSFTEGCCKGKGGACPCKESETAETLVTWSDFPPIDESQELIFPPSLIKTKRSQQLEFIGPHLRLVVPDSEDSLVTVVKENPSARIISSGMFTGMKRRQTVGEKETWIGIWNVANKVEMTTEFLTIGASHSIAQLQNLVSLHCSPTIANGFYGMLDKFSSSKVMNLATWAGSIATGKSSDISTLFLAINAQLSLMGPEAKRKISMEQFVQEGITRDEVIVSVSIPRTMKGRFFGWKAGMRSGADTTVVNCAALLDFTPKVIFGISGRSVNAKKVAVKIMSGSSLEELNSAVEEDLKLLEDSQDFDFKLKLTKAAVFQLFHFNNNTPIVKDEDEVEFTQIFKKTSEEAIGRPISHEFADRSTTGEAVFIADHRTKDAAYVGFVLSNQAHARFTIDTSAALKEPGVLGYYDAKSVPGSNVPGLVANATCKDDTPVFAENEVLSHGQPIAVIVAETPQIAARAAKLVKVNYEPLPAILTLQEAIEAKSELAPPSIFGVAPEVVDVVFKEAAHIVEEEAFLGGQEHMYMETQAAMASPEENDQIVIQSSTQSQAALQNLAASFLDLPANRIVVKTKRCGGAFGGKSHNSFFTAGVAALAAQDLQRPVFAVLSREEDCKITGKRHPMLFKYKVGLDSKGKILAMYVRIYADGGYSMEHSPGVATVAGIMFDICYKVPIIRVESCAMKTNKNSNTAFRGYGNPQVAFAWECMLQKIAAVVGRPAEEIKEINFSHDGDKIIAGSIRNQALDQCWKEVKSFSKFEQLSKEVEEFNKSSKNLKRGVTLGAVRFPLTHDCPAEQASALVQVYLDGSVAVSIGGIEMGQGLFTKCRQVAAKALGVPLSKVTMLECGTDKTANSPETGGSVGADIHGRTIQKGAEKILQSLKPILDEGKTWEEAVKEAYNRRLPLQASEHITIDRASYNIPAGEGTYYTTGAACVVAEVDCISGDHKLISVDIVMDVGESLNPATDIGQIEGGFIQGYGLLSCEDLVWNEDGSLKTTNFSQYALPTAEMVPKKFRVKLLGDTPSYPGQIYSSKGIGEPPLMLGAVAYGAVVKAISAYRADRGRNDWIQMDAPLTRKKILSYLGYGNPQVTFAWECILQKIAHIVKRPVEEIMEINFSHDGDKLMAGTIRNQALNECWKEVKSFSKFDQLSNEIEEFNKSSKNLKRGVTLGAVRFPMIRDCNWEQASALVQVYLDGSVAVSIGGIEMGQGLFTKCRQVAAKALGVALSKVTMLECGTDRTANAPETGGSIGADIHGWSIQKGTEKMLQTLKPLLDEGKTWEQAIKEAYERRLPLQATEHVSIDRASYNIPSGEPCYYSTCAACVLAELISVDIVMDVGESLNPAIDIGQIEGGFIQGYGLLSCENLVWNEDGSLKTTNFSQYALPTAEMVPKKFRVKLLGDTPSYPGQIYSSKEIGEPPLMLGAIAYGAVVKAISAFRADRGRNDWIQMDAPLTRKKILAFCNE